MPEQHDEQSKEAKPDADPESCELTEEDVEGLVGGVSQTNATIV